MQHFSKSHVSLMFIHTGWKTPGFRNFTFIGWNMHCAESQNMIVYSSSYKQAHCQQKRMCTFNYPGSLLSTDTCHFTCYQSIHGDFYGYIYSTDPGDTRICDILLQ